MPKQFVSICGMSACGKKYLIERLIGSNPQWKQRFGLDGTLGVYGKHDASRVALKPPEGMLSAPEDCVLFFWQYATHEWIAKLKAEFPMARHRVILLWRPWEEHRKAFLDPNRLPKERYTADALKWVWKNEIIPRFKEIESQTGVELELLAVSQDSYNPIPWPEV